MIVGDVERTVRADAHVGGPAPGSRVAHILPGGRQPVTKVALPTGTPFTTLICRTWQSRALPDEVFQDPW